MLIHVNVYRFGDKKGNHRQESFMFSSAFNLPTIQCSQDDEDGIVPILNMGKARLEK